MAEDPWSVLGIPRDSPEDEIKSAYRRKLLHGGHPDTAGPDGHPAFLRLTTAYQALLKKAREVSPDEAVGPLMRARWDAAKRWREARQATENGPAVESEAKEIEAILAAHREVSQPLIGRDRPNPPERDNS